MIAAVIGAAIIALGLSIQLRTRSTAARVDVDRGNPAEGTTFVGSEACASCHPTEAKLWRGSQHRLAMQHATDATVLGDFKDRLFQYYDVNSRFFRKDGKFLVETDGPDGKLATFEAKYTFGVDPLQQYLVEFPDGRLQALPLAWDSRPKDQGGQRWFHLYPNENVRHDDVLHWTKLNQNWNFMCAECHSTGVHKNYDSANDHFATTWAEMSVGCEACHGQGSRHLDWASGRQWQWLFGRRADPTLGLLARYGERKGIAWPLNPATGHPERSMAPATLRQEVETCGRCHARRGGFSEDWVPGRWLSDTHEVSPLGRGLYHADGQMLDEVYNYGSFKQSRMFAAGVTCSDCHDPHDAKLRLSGDVVCLQCHSGDKYAAAGHHHHGEASPPLSCTSCHMRAGTYMVVDRRHDHSFRVPRPDLTATLGIPNACNDCHAGQSSNWAAAAIERWFRPERSGFQHYAEGFRSAWNDQPEAEALLAGVASDRNTPAFARAGALAELASRVSPANITLAQSGLSDPDPMVRIGALDMLQNLAAPQLWPLVSSLLSDSNRGVRIRAAVLLAAVPSANQPPGDRERFARSAAEFVRAQLVNADRPESRTALGNYYRQRGLVSDAESQYQAALRLSESYAPAAINLADLYRELGRDREGEGVLRAAAAISPQDAGLHHALGLTLTRLKRPDEALRELHRAAELEPDRARYGYVYAVALHSVPRGGEAVAVLKEILVRHPRDRDTLLALISFARDAGDSGTALEYVERLARVAPDDARVNALKENLRNLTQKTSAR